MAKSRRVKKEGKAAQAGPLAETAQTTIPAIAGPNATAPDSLLPARIAEAYTIPPDQNFIAALAQGISERTKDHPERIAALTLVLPAREAADALRKTLFELSGNKASLFPRIITPDTLEHSHDLGRALATANPRQFIAVSKLPPAISRLKRQLLLANEVAKVPGLSHSPQTAVHLAHQLGQLIDEVQRYELSFDRLPDLAPAAFTAHWQKTLEALKVVTEAWPRILQEEGKMDPAQRRVGILNALTAAWQDTPPKDPVIVAGFTKATPALARFFKVITALDHGTVVFPGIDKEMDEAGWLALREKHPQYAMKQLLGTLGVERKNVQDWPFEVEPAPTLARGTKATKTARAQLVCEANRPVQAAALTEKGPALPEIDPRALQGMELIVNETHQGEANNIGLLMRGALETEGQTAFLVTRDRSLARRVSGELKRWGLNIEDEAGYPLHKTDAGIWLELTARMAVKNLAPVPLLECFKHDFAGGGESHEAFLQKTLLLEKRLLHGPRPPAGFAGLSSGLRKAFQDTRRRMPRSKRAWLKSQESELNAWLEKVHELARPFMAVMADGEPHTFAELLEKHIAFAEALAETDKQMGADRIWAGSEGRKMHKFLSELKDVASHAPDMTGKDYVYFLRSLMQTVTVNKKENNNPRLRILPPEKMRLIKPDLAILGGLNDGTWPRDEQTNPWMSRGMMEKFGLPLPDIDTGVSAHDFVQSISTPRVVLARSESVSHTPTSVSPFLLRLTTTLAAAGLGEGFADKSVIPAINRALNKPGEAKPCARPAVYPPARLRPKKYSFSDVQSLMSDPYSFYTRKIAKIYSRPPIDAQPTMGERGDTVHKALETFLRKYPEKLPDDALEKLLEEGLGAFGEHLRKPTVQAFWWPRFEMMAVRFIQMEKERRRQGYRTLGVELDGKIRLKNGIVITSRTDRLDLDPDGRVVVIDYKTGVVPTKKSVEAGTEPQLPIIGAIAEAGGFEGLDAAPVGKLEYIKLLASDTPVRIVTVAEHPGRLIEETVHGLESLTGAFAKAAMPYIATPRDSQAPRRLTTYQHLQRRPEWRASNDSAKAPVSPKKRTGHKMRTKKKKAGGMKQ